MNIFEVTFMLDSFTEILLKKNTIFTKWFHGLLSPLLYCRQKELFGHFKVGETKMYREVVTCPKLVLWT